LKPFAILIKAKIYTEALISARQILNQIKNICCDVRLPNAVKLNRYYCN